MKHLLTLAVTLMPFSALAHGGTDHLHPHGIETSVAAWIALGGLGAAVLVWIARR